MRLVEVRIRHVLLSMREKKEKSSNSFQVQTWRCRNWKTSRTNGILKERGMRLLAT